MIKTLPFSAEEQSFVAERFSHGFMSGSMSIGNEYLGSLFYALALIFIFTAIKKSKSKKGFWRFMYYLSISLTIAFLFLSFFAYTNPIGIASDILSNMTELFFMIAMIINEPTRWWRYILLTIPGMFIPKAIKNVFQGKNWLYNRTGKIFENMLAGLAFSCIGVITAWMTGKSQKRIEREERENTLKLMRIIPK